MRRLHAAVLAVALLASAPGVARARCSEQDVPRWQAHQTLVLLLNPLGAEHNLRVGLCVPLYRTDDSLLAENHVELGASTYVSPVYAVGGAYAQFAPATFFFTRLELNALGVWTIPLDGAGYFPMPGYGAPFRDPDVRHERGGTAGGWNARLVSVLRGIVDLGPVRLLGLEAFVVDHEEVGDAPFYLDMRNDLVAARSDWILTNDAALLVGIPIRGGPELRFGFYDALRDVPASGYVAHQLGGILMLAWEHPFPGIDSFELFLRVGYHTDHAIRAGEATTLGAASLDHDLGGL